MSEANKRQAKFLAKWIADAATIEKGLIAWDELRWQESTKG